jgi:homoserine dehydrogenase
VQIKTILPIEQIHSAYYLRVVVADKPGVMSEITQILSAVGISIEAIIQKEPARGETQVSVVLITNIVQEKQLLMALETIEARPFVIAKPVRLRVDNLSN